MATHALHRLWIKDSFCGLNFNDLEGNFKFAAWSFSITAQNSSLKADCGWKLWFPRLPGLYFVHTKTKTAKSTRRPSKKNASRPPRAAAKMPSGCWSLEGVGVSTMELTCFFCWKGYMDVSENRGTPKSSILIGFSIIFTIHFGISLFFGNTHIMVRGENMTFAPLL